MNSMVLLSLALLSMFILFALLLPLGLLVLGLIALFVFLVIRLPKVVVAIAGSRAMVVVGMGLFLFFALGRYATVEGGAGGASQTVRSVPESPEVSNVLKSSALNADTPAEIQADSAADAPPADRPAWVDRPGQLRGSVYEIGVKSGLYVTAAECQRGLELAEREAVDEYLESYLGVGASRLVSVDGVFVRDFLENAEYHETSTTSVGKMQQLHALLGFDNEARQIFRERWRRAIVARNLRYVGCGAGLTLAMIAAAYGFLARGNRRARAEKSLAAA